MKSTDPNLYSIRLNIFRLLAITTIVLGIYYLIWRYTSSLNGHAFWFAIPLVAAETFSFIDTILFVFMMWRPPRRVSPPPLEGATVDVFITTYNESADLVHLTIEAAMRIDWPNLKVYLLDDGNRPEIRAIANDVKCGYITRGEEWSGKPRHAKAGNINNALMHTDGEFILILDADQIPAPQIIRRAIGYFREPRLAFVQTPQYFYNLPPGDPFGSDAPLFYGPIMQGKDGWNAAFFCGSNAVLRREALLQLGLTDYVREMEERFRDGLKALEADVSILKGRPGSRESAALLQSTISAARQAIKRGESLEKVSDLVRQGIAVAEETVSQREMLSIAEALEGLAEKGDPEAAQVREHILAHLSSLSIDTLPDTTSLGLSDEALDDLNLTRQREAQPVLPLATISITEDMATAMRLHSLGWQSIFHPEILAYGLAPEDLGSALSQRLRWAQGTLQVFFRENPLFVKGLTIPQRIQYLTTMYSYFSGFTSLVFILSPIIYLFTGIAPVTAWSSEFLWRLIPFLVASKALFLFVAWGVNIWRGEQYSMALFPLWIQAVVSVIFRTKPNFVVTPKQRQAGNYLRFVWPQILMIILSVVAIAYGTFSLLAGWNNQLGGVMINVFWGCYNVLMLLTIVRAAIYRPPQGWEARPPAFLFPQG